MESKLYKNTKRGLIFRNYQILNLAILLLFWGIIVYLSGKGMVYFLAGLAGLVLLILFSPLSINASRIGITNNALLRKWDFKWQDISSWNMVDIGDKKYTIRFRAGGKVYKVSRNVFRENNIDQLKAYFEIYCGSPSVDDDFQAKPNTVKSSHLDLVEKERSL